MSLNATTLSAAITLNQTSFGVASATGISNPNFTTGANVTYLFCEGEMMLVQSVSGTQVSVTRGVYGTQATSHVSGAIVLAGLVTDFSNFTPSQGVEVPQVNRFAAIGAPVASAATITPTANLFHVTGTTATATINLPTNFVEGEITVIADGIWTWTSAGNIAVAGTVTTAGSMVSFRYDANTAKWYPSRLA